MQKVITLYSTLVFGLLTYSDAFAMNAPFDEDGSSSGFSWSVPANEVKPGNSATAFEERLNRLEGIVGKNSEEIHAITTRWFQRGFWIGGLGQRYGNGQIDGRCAPAKIIDFQDDLKRIENRITELLGTVTAKERAGSTEDSSRDRMNQNSEEEEGPSVAAENEDETNDAGNMKHENDAENQQKSNGQDEDTAKEFDFRTVSTEEEVNRLTPEQCQEAVKQGIICKENFFTFAIGEEKKEQDACLRIIRAVKKKKQLREMKVVGNQENFSAKMRILLTQHSDLFRDLEFVRTIKDDLKVFHKAAKESFDVAKNRGDNVSIQGHSYLRFLIVDKI